MWRGRQKARGKDQADILKKRMRHAFTFWQPSKLGQLEKKAKKIIVRLVKESAEVDNLILKF